jgi:hypothetical protein
MEMIRAAAITAAGRVQAPGRVPNAGDRDSGPGHPFPDSE